MQCSSNRSCLRRWASLLVCCAALVGLLTMNGEAVSQVTAQLRPDFTIVIDGSERTFYNAGGQEVQPVLYNGTTYLPVRAIGEIMGKNVDWNQDTKTVTLSGVRAAPATAGTPDASAAVQDVAAELRDDFTVVVDGAVRTFADAGGNRVYPLLYQGSTYLPIRAIGELMGKSVDWNQDTRTVTLGGSGPLVTDADTFSGGGSSGTAPSGQITLEDAKAIALSHAGLTAGQATFTKGESDWEDGRQIYEIEFYTAAGAEYEYEISADTGAVLKSESNLGYATPSGPVGTTITQDRAREIALGQVSGATASCITKCGLDHDGGHHCYEIELVYDCIEYDIEIDGVTGAVLSCDSEVLYCDHDYHSYRHSGGHHGNGHHRGGYGSWDGGYGNRPYEDCPYGECPYL